MKNVDNFNFFKILEKDNKEQIHSAFISYLLDNNQNFRDFINIPKTSYQNSKLEKQYSLKRKNIKKKDVCRIDIELYSEDNKNIIFIENKFKSFPQSKQLEKYDLIFNGIFTKEKNIIKILFCFDKELISFENSWSIFDYLDIIKFIESNYDLKKRDDETIFIKHYFEFLTQYYINYKSILKDSRRLFDKQITNDDKFWLRILNSKIVLHLQNKCDKNNFDFLINPGNTSVPLMNIIPKKWKEKTNEEVLIQFQGKDLKFYIHSNDKIRIQKLINFCEDKLWNENIELKKMNKKNENSCFIFRININLELSDNYGFENIIKVIEDFYYNIDTKIIKKYS